MHVVPSAQDNVQEGTQEWVKPAGSSHIRFLWVPGERGGPTPHYL